MSAIAYNAACKIAAQNEEDRRKWRERLEKRRAKWTRRVKKKNKTYLFYKPRIPS